MFEEKLKAWCLLSIYFMATPRVIEKAIHISHGSSKPFST